MLRLATAALYSSTFCLSPTFSGLGGCTLRALAWLAICTEPLFTPAVGFYIPDIRFGATFDVDTVFF